MTLNGLYRAITKWANRPAMDHDNENALWSLSPRELADLPIGPEPDDALPAFAEKKRDRCA